MRDFVYIKDCVELIFWILENAFVNGMLNVVCAGAAGTTLRKRCLPPLAKHRRSYVDMPKLRRMSELHAG